MNEEEGINPEDITPMGIEVQQVHFEEALWNLVEKFQLGEFELPDANIIYVFESVKATLMEECDMGSDMLDEDDMV
tara:strand:- start:1307 stop:1534 length:228 start_codon:yes stop_codon:yes gene_type:complete